MWVRPRVRPVGQTSRAIKAQNNLTEKASRKHPQNSEPSKNQTSPKNQTQYPKTKSSSKQNKQHPNKANHTNTSARAPSCFFRPWRSASGAWRSSAGARRHCHPGTTSGCHRIHRFKTHGFHGFFKGFCSFQRFLTMFSSLLHCIHSPQPKKKHYNGLVRWLACCG